MKRIFSPVILSIVFITGQAASIEYATVTTPQGMRLRQAPATTGSQIGFVPYKSVVKVHEKNGPENTISGIKARWYKVEYDGKIGWMFSAFLKTSGTKNGNAEIEVVASQPRAQSIDSLPEVSVDDNSLYAGSSEANGEKKENRQRAAVEGHGQDNSAKIDSEQIFGKDSLDELHPVQIIWILEGNVEKLYEDELKEFDSELKMRNYKRTKDYVHKINYLRNLAAKAKNHTFVLTVKLSGDHWLSNYDLKTGTFQIGTQTFQCVHYGAGTSTPDAPGTLAGIFWSNLAFVKAETIANCLSYPLQLKIPESAALQIENNKDSIELEIAYKITGIKALTYRYRDIGNGNVFETKMRAPVAKAIKLRLLNQDSKMVYFDKTP